MSSLNLQTYSDFRAVEVYSYKKHLFPEEEEIFNKYLEKGKFVLDLGCGTGRTTHYLHEKGLCVKGIDISKSMIEGAKKINPEIDFEIGDARKLNIPSESLDYVLFSFNGLDYIHPEKSRLQAINEINRVLKENGLFIFSSHNRLWLYLPSIRRLTRINHRKGSYHIEKTKYGYLITYSITPWKQKKQVEEHGFKLIERFGGFSKSWIYYVARKYSE
ncbi:MAG: class I SAM-dependent methyltransferase [Candidatus Hodarchaeota archaeon]